MTLSCGFGMIFNIIKYIGSSKKQPFQNEKRPDNNTSTPMKQTTKTQQNINAHQVEQVQPIVYIQSGNITSRADGKPISSEEVPYLIETKLKRTLEAEQSRPKQSAKDEELEFQFMQKHEDKSQKLCAEFENLNHAACEENDINLKIQLLQQAIDAYEKAKQWHYNFSKGAKIYFKDFWECYNLEELMNAELQFQIQKRDEIIPWILENAKQGFQQTAIYKEFPENNKADLRKTIDELANQNLVIKIKKGNSYYINKFSTTLEQKG